MKTLIKLTGMFFLALAMSLNARSQEKEVLSSADRMPEFPGGTKSLNAFISENISYPPEAKAEGIQGKVFVSFTVDEKGAVTDFKIVKGVHKLLDAETLRVIGEMPVWQPGEQDGKPVKVRMTLPVIFKLGEPSDNQ